ncbi:hypothetical protein BTJ39_16660 [Izhakiella australiensis]|uniref:Dynamin N-terminal domain-containing protein n=1 Tax=Izhakiella australiensis TaxID=1926881 RepID=A0A1S8YJ36_9GAMM|nr:GTPase domain-containing protein [Izhakiella australiensis]OON38723.1 hypothetical protein BTJ39_16660 [Izhakiella australiensis]
MSDAIQDNYQPKSLPQSRTARVLCRLFPSWRNVLAAYSQLLPQFESLLSNYRALHISQLALQHDHQQLAVSHRALNQHSEEQTLRLNLLASTLHARPRPALRSQAFQQLTAAHLPALLAQHPLPELQAHLSAIGDRLRRADAIGDLAERRLMAVGGGFSSGKSSFITSLIASTQVKLPEGVDAVTAIPTWVAHGDNLVITGIASSLGEVPLSPELYGKLSHRWLQEMGCDLRVLMPFIILRTPMAQYSHLTFIDMPGYNPGIREGYTAEDGESAAQMMKNADAIIWLIGLDANGTIIRDDLDFLRQHAPRNAPFYLVLNKADLRPQSGLQSVIEEVADTLHMENISCAGISAWSSDLAQEFLYQDLSLHDFLAGQNQPAELRQRLRAALEQAFSSARTQRQLQLDEQARKAQAVKSLELDLHELGVFNEQIAADNQIDLSQWRSTQAAEPGRSSIYNLLFNKPAKPAAKHSLPTPEEDRPLQARRTERIAAIKETLTTLSQQYEMQDDSWLAQLDRLHEELSALI